MRILIYSATDDRWKQEMAAIQGQGDNKLCSQQFAQAGAGFVSAEINSNIYGWCLRDTMNDGQGRIGLNYPTIKEVFDKAFEWYSEKPTHREVSCVVSDLTESRLDDYSKIKSATLLGECARRGVELINMHNGEKYPWIEQSAMNPVIFAGVFPTGVSYANMKKEVAGDYKRLAFISFDTLILKIEKDCPTDLAAQIAIDALRLQRSKGQSFNTSSSGQPITLGGRV